MSLGFNFLIVIEPLGLLSSGAGQFFDSGNLSVRSRTRFPPHTPTLSGIYAANYDSYELDSLQLAGPFWAQTDNPQNFYVPAPFNYSISEGKINDRLIWDSNTQQWQTESDAAFSRRFLNPYYWIAAKDWHQPQEAKPNPWSEFPFWHSRLQPNERQLAIDGEQGNLFRENAVQMHPDTCLIYLANLPLSDGWYRFGGEAHTVDLCCLELALATRQLLSQPPGKSFALITPAVWGSNRLSYPEPAMAQSPEWKSVWDVETMLSQSPSAFRYRLGGKGAIKRLSRGRYAVPAGTVYVLASPLDRTWQEWPEDWFPREGYSFKRWGCGLVLPLEGAIADSAKAS